PSGEAFVRDCRPGDVDCTPNCSGNNCNEPRFETQFSWDFDAIEIFGTDYPTRDGTGVRDYIHVSDLADAHLAALRYLADGGDSTALNCGYGRGYSVREVIDVVKQVSGVDFEVRETDRRPGDPAKSIADPSRIHDLLDWEPRREDLEQIVADALAWEKQRRSG
ncbi:MAG: NAD-dependent epimerase/dehydratase family protein, partial [Bradymonadaceae bacterium]